MERKEILFHLFEFLHLIFLNEVQDKKKCSKEKQESKRK